MSQSPPTPGSGNRTTMTRIAAKADRSYEGYPSCTICKVDYLGEGTCGACLLVANLCADSLLVLAESERLRAVIKAAAEVCRNAEKMASLGPIIPLAIALEREVPRG